MIVPELCRIFMPVERTCSNKEYARLRRHTVWDLNQQIIRYKACGGEWAARMDDSLITAQKLSDLGAAVSVIAHLNGWFTNYKEAKSFITRKNA